MYRKLRNFSENLVGNFENIPAERKVSLKKVAEFIQERKDKAIPIKLIYVCTHNSRRSHFGQVAAALAGEFYGINNLQTFSAGTVATSFNINGIKALQEIGFEIKAENNSSNPIYNVQFSKKGSTKCFSKIVSDHNNPTKDFAAIMTCSDAEQNCPVISGAALRIGTTYDDPKKSDGTPEQQATYLARFRQIATEIYYVFSLVK